MDITLNREQEEIAREARHFLKKECSANFVRDMFEDKTGYTDSFWSKITELDWPSICIPEKFGGMGMDFINLVIALEETGRALMPGPFFSTVLLGAETILAAGDEQQKEYYLPKIANGKMKGTLALFEPDSGSDPEYVKLEARNGGNAWILNGTKLFVTDAHVSDFIICAVCTQPEIGLEDCVTLFIVDPKETGITITQMPTMDATRKYCSIDFKDVSVSPDKILGELHRGLQPLSRSLQKAQVGISAESIGGAHFAMETATEYAKVRIQFGQPIGSFQAVKHRCAEMFVDVESSRSLLYYAAWAQDHETATQAAVAASAVKAYATEAFTRVSAGAIHILGGTGIVWENDLHFYLKRAKANEIILGDPVYHYEKIMRLISHEHQSINNYR